MLETSIVTGHQDSGLATLVPYLRCVHCGKGAVHFSKGLANCEECGKGFALRDGRFPDFLTDEDREQLKKELAFWEDHFANTVYQDESEASYQRWATLMQVKNQDTVLEIGCGSGALLTRLPAKVRVGLEPAACLLTATSGFFGVIGSAEAMPFKGEVFDMAFFKHSLHHVQDKAKAFAEAVRVLKKGGRLIIMEPNAEHPQRRLISNPESLFRKLSPVVKLIGPVETFQTVDELVELGYENHLKVEKILYTESHYDRVTVRQRLQRLYSRSLRTVVPQKYLMPNYYVQFRKPLDV
ncbi:MAG: methyltransferase domain-containing protein [Bdellovibrionales bacterium]|nr:methyltransferase domain-containing protein [Bdellovibrionales bacterium]